MGLVLRRDCNAKVSEDCFNGKHIGEYQDAQNADVYHNTRKLR